MFATIKSLIPEPRRADQPRQADQQRQADQARQGDQPRHYVGRHRATEPAPAEVPQPANPRPADEKAAV